MNDDYAWVTERRLGSADGYDDHTATFGWTYYADVPDDRAVANVRITAWSQNDQRGDDVLVDASFTQLVNAPPWTPPPWTNGNAWMTFSVWTEPLAKARTLVVTGTDVTVRSSAGQTRMAAPDRFFVFTLNLTSAWWPLIPGVNTVLVPRSVFLDTKLKADFDAGNYAPLPQADVYGDDLALAAMSDGVAAVIAGTLNADQALDVWMRLLTKASGEWSPDYVDVTDALFVANLPTDVVRIVPWASVVNGPTGALPAHNRTKLGVTATTVVNALVYIGQLIYQGLVALGTSLAWTLYHPLASIGVVQYTSSGSGSFRAEGVSVSVETLYPNRIAAYLAVPLDYTGIDNVTDSSGTTVGRRYVGEPRLVALGLNVTRVIPGHTLRYQEVYFVPRSVFFDTMLYQRLSTKNVAWPLTSLAFRQNATSASSNADDLQQVLSGNVSGDEEDAILDLLRLNTTSGTAYRIVDVNLAAGQDGLFLYSLPDSALRLVGYTPFVVDASVPYRFCSSPNCGQDPVPRPWWEQIWNGVVSVVTAFVTSAIVLAVTAFRMIVTVLSQVGNWAAQAVSTAAAAVASALQAAAKVLEQVFDAIIQAIQAAIAFLFSPLIQAWNDYSRSISATAVSILERHSPSCVEMDPQACFSELVDAVFAPGFYYLVLGLMIGLRVAGAWITAVTFGMSGLLEQAFSFVLGAALGALFGVAVGGAVGILSLVLDYVFQALPSSSPLWREGRSVGVLTILANAGRWFLRNPGSRTAADAMGVTFAFAGFALGFFALAASGIVKFAFAAIGLGLAAFGLLRTVVGAFHLMQFADDCIPNPFEFVPSSIAMVATAVSLTNFIVVASQTTL